MDQLLNSTLSENSSIMSNETSFEEDDSIGKIMRNIELGHRIFIIVFGSIGNCLSVIIFCSKQLRHLSSSFYLSALAVSDTGFLLVVFINWLQGVGFDIFLRDIYCRMQNYFSNVFGFLSVWFVVAFTVERFIAVKYPLMRPSMCTVSRAKAVIGLLCGISLILFIPSLATQWKILDQPETNSSICIPANITSLDAVMNTVDLAAVMVVPCVVIITINTCICFTVRRLNHRRRRMTLSSRCVNPQQLQPRNTHSQNKVTRLLLVVSTVFVCLNLPSYVLRLIVFIPELKVGLTCFEMNYFIPVLRKKSLSYFCLA